MKDGWRRWPRRVGLALLILAAAAQLVRPARTNPPETPGQTLEERAGAPPEVAALLARACADCHSYRTAWPWYTSVTPVSWWIVNHVEQARRHLNLSAWPDEADPKGRERAIRKLEEMCEETDSGAMPLRSYLLLHSEARVSERDVRVLCAWTERRIADLTTPRPPA